MSRPRRTLAMVTNRLEDAVESMQGPALYFSALYDNKTSLELVSEKISEVVSRYNKVLGWWQVKDVGHGDYKLGVVVYSDHKAEQDDLKLGINYERYCF